MEMLLKLLLLLSLTSFVLCSWRFKSGLSQPNINKHDASVLNPHKFNTDKEQCFCIPKTAASEDIDVLLNAQGDTLERLVMYLYKVDGNLQLYIPNKQKQLSVPDLSYSDGDILKQARSEPLDRIFDNNPNVVKWQLKTDASDEEESNVDVGQNEDSSLYSPESSFLEYLDEPAIQDSSYPFQDSQKPDQITSDQVSYPPKRTDELDVTFDQNGNISPENNLVTDLPIKKPLIDQILTPSDENEEFYNVDINQLLKYPSIIPPNLEPEQLKQLLLMKKVPSAYVKNWLNKYKLYNPNASFDDSVTFDQWFQDQLSKVLRKNLELSASPNFSNLKNRIQDVLRKNGMYLSPEGVLYDTYGNELKMSNLNLRPILIGDAIEYQNLLEQQNAGQYVLPTDISYFQAILISLLKPAKVLGVVPLGKISLPGLIADKKSSDEIVSASRRRLGERSCKNCNLKSGVRYRNKEIPEVFLPPSTKELLNSKEPIAALTKLYKKNPQATRRDFSNINERNELNRVIKKILSLFGSDLKEDQAGRRYGDKKATALPKVDDRNIYLNEDDIRQPGFRIIGGKAATSSGTPLSNKGRSGVIH